MRFINYSKSISFDEEFSSLCLYISKEIKLLDSVFSKHLIFLFNMLKKDETYKIKVIEQKNLLKIVKIMDSNDELLFSFDKLYLKIDIFNHDNINFKYPFKFDSSHISEDHKEFIINTIDIKKSNLYFFSQFNGAIIFYDLNEYINDSTSNPDILFYYVVFLMKFKKTKFKLEDFLKSPRECYNLEKMISY